MTAPDNCSCSQCVCRPKDGLVECRKLKLATSWKAAEMLAVAVLAVFTGVSTEARAMLVYSYYSHQIIVTTDERRSGPVDLPPEVGPSIAACWRAPHQGDQVTVQLSFKRDGSIFGKPKINYVKPMNSSTSTQALTESIFKAIDACLPLQFTPRLAAVIAGQVFVIRFIAP
ncbi:MAG TPA: hypothetical protein VE396_09735 [Xanthobacteraceae bacterium]|nr:hypothetical protein [Xanthobacteraceae bacterium]